MITTTKTFQHEAYISYAYNNKYMNTPLTSVVIPTYKRPKMIARAVNSVLKQTYPNIEIIVVDDNDPSFSERHTTEIVMNQFINNPKVRYLKHNKNKNGSAARNTGWKAAIGNYITFLDDDDEIAPNKIAEQVNCLEALDDSWGACYSAYHILMPNGRVQKSTTNQCGDVYIQALMRTLYMGSGSNILLRKKVVDEIGGYDESFRRNQDIEFMARVFENYKLAFIPKDLLTIHLETRSSTSSSFKKMDAISEYYLKRFASRINSLSPRDKHRVIAVISLDRARLACYYKEYKEALNILKTGGVEFLEVFQYLIYLANRGITGKSYGFYIK